MRKGSGHGVPGGDGRREHRDTPSQATKAGGRPRVGRTGFFCRKAAPRRGRGQAAWPGRPDSGNSLGSVYYKIGGGVLKRIASGSSAESVALSKTSRSDDTVKSSIVLGSSL